MPCVVHLLRLKCSAQAGGDPATLRMRPNLFPHDRGYGGYSPEQNGAWFGFACLACREAMHRATSEPCSGREGGRSRTLRNFRWKTRGALTLPSPQDRIEKKKRGARQDARVCGYNRPNIECKSHGKNY